MRRVREVIVVEGRYDKNALRQVVDATVVETRGFGVFNDRERLALLRRLAEERGLVLMDAIKTAYATAYYRLLLLLKSGCIGEIVSVDVTCTSLKVAPDHRPRGEVWNSIATGPHAQMLFHTSA